MVGLPDKMPICYVNGKRRILPRGQAELTLLEYLRGEGLDSASDHQEAKVCLTA